MPDVKFSNLYPYTDFHELNLDWVIKEVKFWSERVGKSIQKIELTGTVGLVDTYTITYSDGSTSTFDVTNGNGIASVAKTGTAGLVDTYTITFQDGSTTTFDVHNGTASIDATLSIAGRAADAKVTGDAIDDVKNAITQSAELKSGYITYSNGTVHSSSTRHYSEFPVAYGMSVYYKFTEGAAYNFGLAFYDTSGKYISGNIVTNSAQTIEVPESAVVCKATVATLDDAYAIGLNSAIQKNRVTNMSQVGINNSEFDLQTNKYAYYDRAAIATFTGLNVIRFPVFEGLTFIYSMKNSNPNYVGLHFVNETGGFVSGVQATANPATVITPAAATYCNASVYNISEIQFINVGNAIFDRLSVSNNVFGLETTSEPLESIEDKTGMLDIFLHVGCIGDSLASGESYWNDGGTTQGADYYQYSWGQYLARKTGNTFYNWSKGGLSTKLWLQSTYATECFDGNHLCEAYIIGLGQNDANYNYTIGSASDIDLADYHNNADSFYGSYGKIIQKIKEVQPQAKIFVITDPNTTTDTKGYNVPIRDMATIFTNVYVIDLRQYALKYMSSPVLVAQLRAGHFNAYGYKVFAMMIANYIDWIVTTNYTEFTQIELIGTGHSWV